MARAPAETAPLFQPSPALNDALLDWYAERARPLPWRGEGLSLYRTWVSEVMCQQTRVDTVIPYFERWMRAFPTVEHLANAPLDDVLAHWSGLGYYSRARNLHAGAEMVVAAGGFPTTLAGWRALPGVGEYIAGAVGSIALGLDSPAVDGNLERVLSRVHRHPGGRPAITALAQRLLPPGRAGDWNQALMDLGASLCAPRAARCGECPIRAHCGAGQLGEAERWPAAKERKVAPERAAVGALVRDGDRILFGQRLPEGLFGGLFELPGLLLPKGAATDEAALRGALQLGLMEALGVDAHIGGAVGQVAHVLTHMRLQLVIFEVRLSGEPAAQPGGAYQGLRWLGRAERGGVGLSTLASKALALADAAPSSQGSLF